MNDLAEPSADQPAPPESPIVAHAKQAAIAAGVVLAAIVALSFVTKPRPTVSEKDRAAVEEAADRLTHEQIADAWTRMKLGDFRPMRDIRRTFPLPHRTTYEDGDGLVLVFKGHGETCIDFLTRPKESMVSARHC